MLPQSLQVPVGVYKCHTAHVAAIHSFMCTLKSSTSSILAMSPTTKFKLTPAIGRNRFKVNFIHIKQAIRLWLFEPGRGPAFVSIYFHGAVRGSLCPVFIWVETILMDKQYHIDVRLMSAYYTHWGRRPEVMHASVMNILPECSNTSAEHWPPGVMILHKHTK
jgi:hypothetical protein